MPKGLKEDANQQKLSNFVASSSVEKTSPAPPPIPHPKGNCPTKRSNQDNSVNNNKKEKTGESKKRKNNSGDKAPTKKLIEDKEG